MTSPSAVTVIQTRTSSAGTTKPTLVKMESGDGSRKPQQARALLELVGDPRGLGGGFGNGGIVRSWSEYGRRRSSRPRTLLCRPLRAVRSRISSPVGRILISSGLASCISAPISPTVAWNVTGEFGVVLLDVEQLHAGKGGLELLHRRADGIGDDLAALIGVGAQVGDRLVPGLDDALQCRSVLAATKSAGAASTSLIRPGFSPAENRILKSGPCDRAAEM